MRKRLKEKIGRWRLEIAGRYQKRYVDSKEDDMCIKKSLQKQVYEIIEEVTVAVCDNLCKYRETADEDLICDYMRENGSCPLDKLK